jgi:hypothetical protein
VPTALSESDRVRVRHHLGYLNTEPISSIALGFPSAGEAQFLVERAMDRLIPQAVPIIIKTINILDTIEMQMVEALRRLKAQQLGELKMRNSNEEPTEQDLLEREYVRWAKRLADDLGCTPNPYSQRFGAGSNGINIPVDTGV